MTVLSASQSKETLPKKQINHKNNHANFLKKTLEQFPNLYYECSSENFDYYGITSETLCPLCKLDHEGEEGIEGKYKNGFYYIKCEVSEIGTAIQLT